MMHTYWSSNGEEQAKYNEMMNAEFGFTQHNFAVMRSYYRYFNDGDLPGWARGRGKWEYTRIECTPFGRFERKLNDKGLQELERRVTEAILAEHKRFSKRHSA